MRLPCHAIPGPEIAIEGRTYLYFGGTSYLGMQTDPEFLEAAALHTREMGTHWGASRSGNVYLSIYPEAESRLASWMGSPSCLTMSSGFLAARLLSEYFRGPRYACFYSPNCHEALLAAGGERARDWDGLYKSLEAFLTGNSRAVPVVFSDTMGGPERGGPVWDQLGRLPGECILVADDSHGIGITGADGSGSWKLLSEMGFRELVLCGSLGKAMGVTSGVISGTSKTLESLQATPFFSGASPAPPAGLSALAEGLEKGWYRQKQTRLKELLRYFYGAVGHLELLQFSPDYPVITFRNRALAKYLREQHVVITDFQYKAEAGPSSPSRIVITSSHQVTHLRRLAGLLCSFEESP